MHYLRDAGAEKVLVEAGMEVDRPSTKYGNTALHCCLFVEDFGESEDAGRMDYVNVHAPEMVKFLILAGADIVLKIKERSLMTVFAQRWIVKLRMEGLDMYTGA